MCLIIFKCFQKLKVSSSDVPQYSGCCVYVSCKQIFVKSIKLMPRRHSQTKIIIVNSICSETHIGLQALGISHIWGGGDS